MDFDYPHYVTSTKLKQVNDKNVKTVSHLILKIKFLNLFDSKSLLSQNPLSHDPTKITSKTMCLCKSNWDGKVHLFMILHRGALHITLHKHLQCNALWLK